MNDAELAKLVGHVFGQLQKKGIGPDVACSYIQLATAVRCKPFSARHFPAGCVAACVRPELGFGSMAGVGGLGFVLWMEGHEGFAEVTQYL